MAGQNDYPGQYEFQCLHGMGEPLYDQVVGPSSEGKLSRPCRIYAPVGTHDTLLAYLVRRLLENGADTSFVNRIGDDTVPVSALVTDPVDDARAIAAQTGVSSAPHPRVALPRQLFAGLGDLSRPNSAGLNLAHEQQLASLAAALLRSTQQTFHAAPTVLDAPPPPERAQAEADGWLAVLNPADPRNACAHYLAASPVGHTLVLPGPTGESNRYRLLPRQGGIWCMPQTALGLLHHVAASLAQAKRA